MKRRRADLIVSQVLAICEGGARKTKIVYQANLNSERVDRYLEGLIRNGLIERVIIGSRVIYKTTDKGIMVRGKFERIQSEINELRDGVFDTAT